MTELSLIEGLVVCGASAVVQSLPRDWANPKFEQTLFNLATMSLSTTLAWEGFHRGVEGSALLLPFAAAIFFFGQTAPVATIIALTGGEPLLKTWKSISQLTFPYFVLSAGVASFLRAASPTIEWQLSLLALPIMFSVFCSYQLYLRTESVTNESLRIAASAGG